MGISADYGQWPWRPIATPDPTAGSPTLAELTARGMEVAALYDELNLAQRGRVWTRAETMMGFVGDVGDLAKLVMAAEGARSDVGGLVSRPGRSSTSWPTASGRCWCSPGATTSTSRPPTAPRWTT